MVSERKKFGGQKNKSGQMKIQQTAFVLMAVTLFFVLVGLLLIVLRFNGLKQSATELQQENAMLLASKLADSPEFSCGDAYGGTRVSCVDYDKVMALKNRISDYAGFWGVSSIEIMVLYPESQEIPIYSDGKTGYSVSNFVALCKKDISDGEVYNKCELAELIVGYANAQ